jgi:hypothetical protein
VPSHLNLSTSREPHPNLASKLTIWQPNQEHQQNSLYITALATCLTYIDLNPILVGMAETPKQSKLTVIVEIMIESDYV